MFIRNGKPMLVGNRDEVPRQSLQANDFTNSAAYFLCVLHTEVFSSLLPIKQEANRQVMCAYEQS